LNKKEKNGDRNNNVWEKSRPSFLKEDFKKLVFRNEDAAPN